jgi:type II secretion system protein H
MTFRIPAIPTGKPPRVTAAGFTLIELIIVMTLIAFVTALVVPNLASFFRGRTLDHEARRLLSLTSYAHSRAIAEGLPIELWFDASTGAYGATVGAGFTEQDPRAVEYTLDSELTLTLETEEAEEPYEFTETFESAPDVAIVFQPDGLIQSGGATLLRLEQSDGYALTVALDRLGTGFEILSDDDLALP